MAQWSTYCHVAFAWKCKRWVSLLLCIGCRSVYADHNFNGAIDDLRIYNRPLSSNEVAQLYAFESDVPIITTQPQNQSVAQGGTATFSVVAPAANPLTYQWFKDGMVLTSATNTTLP